MVVSNTSPINYLVLIGQIDVLPALFGEITIPQAVRDEWTHPDAPAPLRAWIVIGLEKQESAVSTPAHPAESRQDAERGGP